MKAKYIKIFFSVLFLFVFSQLSFAQEKPPSFGFRMQGQIDFQKESYALGFPNVVKEHRETVFNYGFDMLAIKKVNSKIDLYAGVGFFRNKFSFSRYYNHQLLNPSNDSTPLGLATKNYAYYLLRIPIGINFYLMSLGNTKISLSTENVLNFSFLQIYNSTQTLYNSQNKLKVFKFYGDNILIRLNIWHYINGGRSLVISPYFRIFNLYNHNDPVFYNNDRLNYVRWVDAIGLSTGYFFNKKNKL
jgi:hypothetical protein